MEHARYKLTDVQPEDLTPELLGGKKKKGIPQLLQDTIPEIPLKAVEFDTAQTH